VLIPTDGLNPDESSGGPGGVGPSGPNAATVIGPDNEAAFFPDRCDIWRYSAIDDNAGGRRKTWALVDSDVPCFIHWGATAAAQVFPQPKEVEFGGKMRTAQTHNFGMALYRDIRAQDRIKKGNYTWEVIDVSGGETDAILRYGVMFRIGPQTP
jgi:hypothetical protein